ncbi:hypothetical protein, partial [Pseudomonas shirazensis]
IFFIKVFIGVYHVYTLSIAKTEVSGGVPVAQEKRERTWCGKEKRDKKSSTGSILPVPPLAQ